MAVNLKGRSFRVSPSAPPPPTGDLVLQNPLSYPPISNLGAVTIQTIARPPYLTWVTDSTYGYNMEIMRVTDNNGVFGSPTAPYVLDPGYSKQQNWNANGTLFKIGRRYILDATTNYTYIKSAGTPTGMTVWSNVDPKKLWVVGGGKITAFDVTVPSSSATMYVHDFSSLYNWSAEWSLGNFEGNVTDDDKYMLIMTQKVGSTEEWFVKINLETGTVESERSLTQLGIPYTVDWAGVSAGGKYIIAAIKDAGGAALEKRVYDATTWAPLGTLGSGDHMDFTYDADGREVMLKMNGPRVIDIASKATLEVIPSTTMNFIYGGGNSGGHSSGQARKLRGWGFYSFTSDNNPIKEVFAARLDGSQEVIRFCPMRYDRYDYSAEPQASPNRDGTMVTFASNWLTGANGSVDTYIVRRKQ